MGDKQITVRELFAGTAPDADGKQVDQWAAVKAGVGQEFTGVTLPSVLPGFDEKIMQLFDVAVPDMFVVAWNKSLALEQLLKESEKSPEEEMSLELAEHTIESEHHPYLEVRVENLPPKRVELTVKLEFKLKGFVLIVKAGEIRSIESGEFEVKGNIEYKGLKLPTPKLHSIKFPGSISLEMGQGPR